MSSVCKVSNCECLKQEIPLHVMYWLAHQGIDIRPLFQRPYVNSRRKYKSSSSSTRTGDNILATSEESNVLDEFLNTTWSLQPDPVVAVENTVVNNTSNSAAVRRSAPYKLPVSSKRRV